MSKPSLKAELVSNLAFLAFAALLLGVASILILESLVAVLPPKQLLPLVLATVLLDLTLFTVLGRYLVTRHVLVPLQRLMQAADAVAAGDLEARAPDAETSDFSILAERFNRMTDHLVDAQGQLVRSEKLASVGLLAAGLAHEIGNPLGAIGAYVEVVRRGGGGNDVLMGVTREVERIDTIVRGLLDYARPRDEAVQALDVAGVARGAFDLIRGQGAFKACDARLEIGPDIPRVRGRAHALEQALVNLLLNAIEAVPGRGAVVLGVHRWRLDPGRTGPPTRRATDPLGSVFPRSGERRSVSAPPPAGATGALVLVADAGAGVPPVDRTRVFEPFFTTKEPGRGTGLGLAIVSRAVYDMGGLVWVEEAREGGAAFKLFLPEAVA